MTTTASRFLKTTALTAAALVTLGLGLSVAPGEAQAADPTCNRVVSTQALSFSQRNWPLTGGLHMSTTGSYGRDIGTVSGVTHLYNSYWGMGYTGSVTVLAYNSCGELIGVTPTKSWGVDAKSWFWNSNERREAWSVSMPAEIATRTATVQVVHNRVTGDALASYRIWRDRACTVFSTYYAGPCLLPKL